MKRIIRILWQHKKISLMLIAILIVLFFFVFFRRGSSIETITIKKQNLVQSVTTSGEVKSAITVKLSFLAAGKLVYLNTEEGSLVKKWQTLASLDSRTVQKNLESTLRDYSKQRNSFDDTLENNQNRRPDQALNDDMKRILQNNQYDLEKSVLSVELQDLAKEQSYLLSPIDGVVIKMENMTVGMNIPVANSVTVADPVNVNFYIEVDEANIGKIKLGLPVKVFFEAYPDDTVDLIVDKIDFASHTSSNGGNVFGVEARFPQNPDYKYKIGMTGDAEIIITKKIDALAIPLGSLTDDNSVYVKGETGFVKRKVKLGIQSDTDIEVTNGLKVGDIVAQSPDEAEALQENTKKFIFF